MLLITNGLCKESEEIRVNQLPDKRKWYVGYEQEYDIDAGDDGRTIGYPTGRDEFDGTVFEVDEDGDWIETVAEQIRDEKTAHLIAAVPQMIEALHMAYEVLGQPQISERRRFEVAEKIREAIDAGIVGEDLSRDGNDGR